MLDYDGVGVGSIARGPVRGGIDGLRKMERQAYEATGWSVHAI